MEPNRNDKSSDRDRNMMGRYESYSDKQEAKDKDKKKKKYSSPWLSPAIEKDDAKDKDSEEDKKPGLFELLTGTEEEEENEDDSVEVEENPETEEAAVEAGVEAEESLEEIDEEESSWVEEQLITGHQEELASELGEVEDDTAEEAEILADAALLENLQERVEQGESLDDETIEEALAETIDELELSVEPEETEDDDVEDADEDEDESGIEEAQPTPEEDEEDPPPPPPTPSAPTTSPPVSPTTRVPAAHLAGSGMGLPPTPPSEALRPIEATEESKEMSPGRRRSRGSDILVGGIVGYLLGRRRGRLRTEEKLIPVQEKLKDQVNELNDKIIRSEEKIRKLTAEKIEQLDGSPTVVIERLEQRIERKRGISRQPETSAIEQEIERAPSVNEALTVPKLLEVAEGIRREGVTVKHLYEIGRLDAEGLRRVVQEYLRGGAYEQILFEELKGDEYAREQSFERATTSQVKSDTASLGAGGLYAQFSQDSLIKPEATPGLPNEINTPLTINNNSQSYKRQVPLLAVVAFGIIVAVAIILVMF